MLLAIAGTAGVVTGSAFAQQYQSAVLALNPSHYYQLNETVVGTAADSVGGVTGVHGGDFGPGFAEVGVPGPFLPGNVPLPGLGPNNKAFLANNFGSITTGPGANMANSVMTVATWFQVGTGFPGGSDGGDRIWTNNQTDPETSFQITLGGVQLVIGLDPSIGGGSWNGVPGVSGPTGPTVGSFQITEETKLVKSGNWHHVVASRNGRNIENCIIVIDGVNYPPITWSDSTDSWGTTGTDARIASRDPGDGGPSLRALNGPIDEVAVWLGRQLTVAESIALYQAALGAGDYNDDGVVNAADYTVWRDTLGSTTNLAADGNSNLVVDAGDYTVWQNAYPSGGATAVPEPTSALGGAVLVTLAGLLRRGRSADRR
ncbi:MAG: hypothetical protein ACRCT8_17370 [Lacipirellulaceae bacterium]